MLIVTSPRFVEHTPPPGHPERPERAQVFAAVAEKFAASGGLVEEPQPVSDSQLARVHTAEYLAQVAAVDGRAAMLDADPSTAATTDPETSDMST